MSIYDKETTSKIYPDLNLTAPQEPQTYRLKKLTEIEAYLLDKIEFVNGLPKNETIHYNHNHRGRRSNYINSDHWSSFYCRIC